MTTDLKQVEPAMEAPTSENQDERASDHTLQENVLLKQKVEDLLQQVECDRQLILQLKLHNHKLGEKNDWLTDRLRQLQNNKPDDDPRQQHEAPGRLAESAPSDQSAILQIHKTEETDEDDLVANGSPPPPGRKLTRANPLDEKENGILVLGESTIRTTLDIKLTEQNEILSKQAERDKQLIDELQDWNRKLQCGNILKTRPKKTKRAVKLTIKKEQGLEYVEAVSPPEPVFASPCGEGVSEKLVEQDHVVHRASRRPKRKQAKPHKQLDLHNDIDLPCLDTEDLYNPNADEDANNDPEFSLKLVIKKPKKMRVKLKTKTVPGRKKKLQNEDGLMMQEGDGEGKDGAKEFTCSTCGRAFNQAGNLQRHMLLHTGEKPFQCQECGRSFRQTIDLIRHKRTHTGEKPFMCFVCGHRFTVSNALQRHVRTHTGERPNKCSVCNKAFADAGMLQNHMRIHTGEKPYMCSICGKNFNRSHHLANHMKTHTGEKPYTCTVCNKSFTQIGSLRSHSKVHFKTAPDGTAAADNGDTAAADVDQHSRSSGLYHTEQLPEIKPRTDYSHPEDLNTGDEDANHHQQQQQQQSLQPTLLQQDYNQAFRAPEDLYRREFHFTGYMAGFPDATIQPHMRPPTY